MHAHSVAVTLTYAVMPEGGNVSKRDVQLFMKRLRKRIRPHKVRYFAGAEYGPNGTRRPHYHLCIFGHGFPDRVPAGKSRAGIQLFESAQLTAAWGLGRVAFSDLTLESAMYAAQYALKKLSDDYGGRSLKRTPEFWLGSRRPGLGRKFLDTYATDIFRGGGEAAVVMRGGASLPIPKYYERVLREWCEDDYEALKAQRREWLDNERRIGEAQPGRLAVREECAVAGVKRSKRDVV